VGTFFPPLRGVLNVKPGSCSRAVSKTNRGVLLGEQRASKTRAQGSNPCAPAERVLIVLQFTLSEVFRWRRYQSKPHKPEEIANIVDDAGSGTALAVLTLMLTAPPEIEAV
jgi:hypothetical protein